MIARRGYLQENAKRLWKTEDIDIHYDASDLIPKAVDWLDVRRQAGVYCMLFPNGKRYVGKTNDLIHRLDSHLIKLLQAKSGWYKRQEEENGKCYGYKMLTAHIKLSIIYTDTEETARIIEHEILTRIKEKGNKDKVYNSQFS